MDFPSNSHISKTPEEGPSSEKNIQRVVTGEVKRRKKPLSRKFKEVLVGEDVRSVWDYILFDVIVPAAKDMISDAITQGFERIIFGESRPNSRRRSPRPGTGYVSYNQYSSSTNRYRDDPRNRSSRRPNSKTVDDIILPTRNDAEDVLDQMFNLLQQYEQVTVSDLYELIGVQATFTDERWGWTDLRGASARRISSGYLLDLPRPESL